LLECFVCGRGELEYFVIDERNQGVLGCDSENLLFVGYMVGANRGQKLHEKKQKGQLYSFFLLLIGVLHHSYHFRHDKGSAEL